MNSGSYGRYNTAVKGRADSVRHTRGAAHTDRAERVGGVITLVHDICMGAAPEFSEAGCIYSEIAWRAGYKSFTTGTEAEHTSHGDYLAGLLSVIYSLQVPTLIVCGKHEERLLHPHDSKGIRFTYHHCQARLCAWYTHVPEHVVNDIGACNYLIDAYDNILDPCCGFGNTMTRALQRGRGCIMADVDPECVQYVRHEAARLQAMTPHTP